MSLINDALKKAARQRAEAQADLSTLMPGGGGSRASGHGAPMRKQTVALIAGAAVALAVVSAVVTSVLMGGKTAPAPVAAAPAPQVALPRPQATPAPAVQAPVVIAITVPKVILTTPSPTAAPVVVEPVRVAAPVAAARIPDAPPASTLSHADQVQAYVDGLHVSGARAAGSDSKALVDGHVFKVNDLLNRTLGVRLIQVDPDHLTFVDSTGAAYLKSY
jgi:hypothetical protein